jgi:lysophospholipid acyltransferase (LPLAT)-like uncharacterized protein
MKMKDYLLLGLVPPVGAGLIRLVRRSMRIETVDPPPWEELNREKGGVIYAFWHNRLFLMPCIYRGRKSAVLISRHRDGEIISRTMGHFGFTSVRGSSTRGGASALRQMPRLVREGRDLAITPDGPRGPAYRVQPGVILTARLSGRPVLPVTFASDRFFSFNSWDRFQVPKPLSRGVFVWGEPLTVKRSDDLEQKRQELEDSLNGITARADGWFAGAVQGAPVPSPPERKP